MTAGGSKQRPGGTGGTGGTGVTRLGGLRVIGVSAEPSSRVRASAAAFGLLPEPAEPTGPPDMTRAASNLKHTLEPGSLAMVTGPSGSGKSSLLRALADAVSISLRPDAMLAAAPDAAIIDALGRNLHDAMRVLSAAGLAEPVLWSRTPDELSDGERARLGLALAMDAIEQASQARAWLIIDEFGSAIDDATAVGLCATLCRWLRSRPRVRVVVATLRPELAEHLKPAVRIDLQLDAGRDR